MNQNVMIVGVGGQGSLLASKMLGHVVMQAGYDVKVSEVHGMSQRGGSVVTYVRYSDETVWSPVINEGEADIIISFELLEAARWVGFLKKGGTLVANDQKIAPMPVIMGNAQYPEDIAEKLRELLRTFFYSSRTDVRSTFRLFANAAKLLEHRIHA